MTTARGASPLDRLGTTGIEARAGRIQEELLQVLRNFETKMRIYTEMRNDATVSVLLDALKLPLEAAAFSVVAASEDPSDVAAKEFVEENLKKMDKQTWLAHVQDMLEALDYGFAMGEIVLEKREDGHLWLKNIEPRGQETLFRWEFDDHDKPVTFIQRHPVNGNLISIPLAKMVHITLRGRKGNPEGDSILRSLYWTYQFKKDLEVYEAIGIERDVGGMPIFEIPDDLDLDDDDLADIDKAGAAMRQDERAFLRLPSGVKVNPYPASSKAYNIGEVVTRKKIEILQRGFSQFLALGTENVGTQALVQGDVDFFSLGLISIQNQMLESWNQQLIPFLLRYNGMSTSKGMPTLRWAEPGKMDFAKLIQSYVTAVTGRAIKYRPADEDYLRDVLGLPKRAEITGEEIGTPTADEVTEPEQPELPTTGVGAPGVGTGVPSASPKKRPGKRGRGGRQRG